MTPASIRSIASKAGVDRGASVQELEAHRARLERAGIRALLKPFDVEELLLCIRQLLDREGADIGSPQGQTRSEGAEAGAATDRTLFGAAWEGWRRDLTAALLEEASVSGASLRDALEAVGAYRVEEGLIERGWALGVLTRDETSIERLRDTGMDAATVERLVAVIERHPAPAAGG